MVFVKTGVYVFPTHCSCLWVVLELRWDFGIMKIMVTIIIIIIVIVIIANICWVPAVNQVPWQACSMSYFIYFRWSFMGQRWKKFPSHPLWWQSIGADEGKGGDWPRGQGQCHRYATCAVTQGPTLRKALCSVSCSVVAVLRFLIHF